MGPNHEYEMAFNPNTGRVIVVQVQKSRRPVKVKSECRCSSVNNVPADAIQVRESDNMILINGVIANIHHYRKVVPNLVLEVYFIDGSKEKVVVREGDTYDLDTGLRIAVAKHVGKQYYNLKGIENLAERLSYLKCIDKMLHKAHQQYKMTHPEEFPKPKKDKNNTEKQDSNLQDAISDGGGKNDVKEEDTSTENTATPPKPKVTSGHRLNITTSKHGVSRSKNRNKLK